MADADVSAMFQSRKAKKGKKKFKTFSANKLVSRLEAGGLADGGAAEVRGTLGMSNTGLEKGEWVDDDETIKPTTTLLSSEVSDFNPSAEAEAAKRALKPKLAGGLGGRKNVGQVDQQLAKQEFHTARAKAVVEAEKKASQTGEEVKPAPAPAKVGWRAKHAATKSAVDKNGMAALKELDNESVFPTLGGPVGGAKPKAGGPQAAWGQVEEKALSAVKAVIWVPQEAQHLGEDFYPCESFEGEKGGYGYSLGEKGLGYYWLSSAVPAKEEEEVVDADVLKPSATAWKPRSGRPRNTELPPDGDDESAAGPPPPAPIGIGAGASASSTDDDRFKPSAKAWKPRGDRPRNTDKYVESDEEDAAPAAGAVAEEAEDADADRFAGLKKKKKKKKSTTEVAEE